MAVSKQEITCNAAQQAGSARQTALLTPLQTGTQRKAAKGASMSARHRINGTVPYTCENAGYKTNITKGSPHGLNQVRGSVFDHELVAHGSYTLWLEHVTHKASGAETFWLMWYDSGIPTIPLRSRPLQVGWPPLFRCHDA